MLLVPRTPDSIIIEVRRKAVDRLHALQSPFHYMCKCIAAVIVFEVLLLISGGDFWLAIRGPAQPLSCSDEPEIFPRRADVLCETESLDQSYLEQFCIRVCSIWWDIHQYAMRTADLVILTLPCMKHQANRSILKKLRDKQQQQPCSLTACASIHFVMSRARASDSMSTLNTTRTAP